MPLNLSYIPLKPMEFRRFLYVIYSKENENPLIPLIFRGNEEIEI